MYLFIIIRYPSEVRNYPLCFHIHVVFEWPLDPFRTDPHTAVHSPTPNSQLESLRKYNHKGTERTLGVVKTLFICEVTKSDQWITQQMLY